MKTLDIKSDLIPVDIKNKIMEIESAMRKSDVSLGEDPFPLKHTFTPGIYCREINVPCGMLVVTKIHKTEHVVFLLKGDVSILSEMGISRIKAPYYMISPVGAKRVVYTHEDTVWVNIHANPENSLDIKELENKIIAKDYKEVELCHGLESLPQ